jgi:hypothetical protein
MVRNLAQGAPPADLSNDAGRAGVSVVKTLKVSSGRDVSCRSGPACPVRTDQDQERIGAGSGEQELMASADIEMAPKRTASCPMSLQEAKPMAVAARRTDGGAGIARGAKTQEPR